MTQLVPFPGWHSYRRVAALGFILWSLVVNLLAEPTQRIYPIPTRVDRTEVAAAIYLRVFVEDFGGQRVADLVSPGTNKELDKFLELFSALKRKDSQAGQAMVPPEMNDSGVSEYFQSFADTFAPHFGGATLHQAFYAGDSVNFIWGYPVGEKVVRRSLRFILRNGEYRWDGGTRDTLAILLTAVAQRIADRPAEFAHHENATTEYEYPIPTTLGRYPVHLLFNGYRSEWDLLEGDPTKVGRVLESLQHSYRMLSNKDLEAVSKTFTNESRGKFLKWAQSMTPEALSSYVADDLRRSRNVVFTIHADPIYIVFSEPRKGPESVLTYNYVLRGDGEFLRTNFFFEGYLDDYLKDPQLFSETILRPLLAVGAEWPLGDVQTPVAQLQPVPANAPENNARGRKPWFWRAVPIFLASIAILALLKVKNLKNEN